MEKQRVDIREEATQREVRSYVLRAGRLNSTYQRALELYSADHALEFSHTVLDFEQLFGNNQPVTIEIGFGMGEATIELAQRYRERNYLGIEVFLNGFAKVLHAIATQKLSNLKIIRFDAVAVLTEMIADESVSAFHIFFPDPWPKKRHHKRRLIQRPLVELLTQKLTAGGYIYCVSDWEEYAKEMVEVFAASKQLINPHNGYAPKAPWRPTTSFERKGIAQNHQIREIIVYKKDRPE